MDSFATTENTITELQISKVIFFMFALIFS